MVVCRVLLVALLLAGCDDSVGDSDYVCEMLETKHASAEQEHRKVVW